MQGIVFEEEKKMDAADLAKSMLSQDNDDKVTTTALPPSENYENAVASSSRRASQWAGHLLRTIILDLPLLVVLFTYAGVVWCNHVGEKYLVPQYHDMLMTEERQANEMTYYVRECTVQDMPTLNGMDLFLPQNATVEDAYQHQLLHGFTVFRSVLQPDTATTLRNYIAAKNYNLTEQESIFVIENENRYSFGLGTDEPIVARAMKELTNHPLLRQTVEKVVGPDPALIEMTAITSSYGALDQHWHDDVIPQGSPIRHARAFGPSYSIFVQLQNTTKSMGATGACPGTHYCSGGVEMMLCEQEGFQLVNEEGHWAQGDALLMNMNSFHRGAAHTDPDALDRVMLILTFVPKPKDYAESRRMAQGITFSLRWDMWGHTWDDLAHADMRMGQPWATLRALAMYKPKEANWGIDWFTSSSMRGGGMETGFNDEAMEDFQRWGQLKWLPMFLQEQGLNPQQEHVWLTYATRTAKKVETFMGLIVFSTVCGYAIMFALVGILQTKRSWAHAFSLSLFRLGAFCAFAYVFYAGMQHHVDSTRWAADIRGGRRYSSVFKNDGAFGVKTDGVTTLPHRKDVLIENRFGSSYLHMYNDYINGHPGNRHFLRHVDAVGQTYAMYPTWLREASARYIAESVLIAQGRFLEQGVKGNWYVNDFEEAVVHTKKVLVSRGMPVVGEVLQELRFITSGYRFGTLRDTKLAQKHMVPFVKSLEKKIIGAALEENPSAAPARLIRPADTEVLMGDDKVTVLSFESPVSQKISPYFKVDLSIRTPSSAAANKMRTASFKVIPRQPEPGAWFASGSKVEAFTEGYWFIGEITHVSAFGEYHVVFPDGEEIDTGREFVREFYPYKEGERLQVYLEGWYDYADCMIVAREDDDTYHAVMAMDGQYYDKIQPNYFRRFHYGPPIEPRTYISAYLAQ